MFATVGRMDVRPYRATDEAACLALFESNTPDFFTLQERADFANYLRTMSDPYFVVEDEGQVVACGGVFVRHDRQTAGLAWGMVGRTEHRRGYGRALLNARLDWLRQHAPEVGEVILDTSQHSAPFFAHLGFETTRVERDHYAPGLDRHDMRLLLGAPGRRPEAP